ncbi:MAG TPA: AraC family transcriptional regulator [Chitinophagaceae bacterium]
MTYYQQQIFSIFNENFPNVYLLKQVMQAKYYMDNNYSDNITLEDICREACFSKFHLIRSFKSIYGRTPNQYLTSVRIQKAKELLKNGATVMEASLSVGFDSTTTFTGLFKKQVGTSPSAFKKNCAPKKAILKRF